MPFLAERDFEKIADIVVSKYLEGAAKLAEAAAEEAITKEMNPDQIERMVQAANTLTFLRLMDKQIQAKKDNLLEEFEPIDSRTVIKLVIDKNGVQEVTKEASHWDEYELPNERNGVSEKVASDDQTYILENGEFYSVRAPAKDDMSMARAHNLIATSDEKTPSMFTTRRKVVNLSEKLDALNAILKNLYTDLKWNPQSPYAKSVKDFTGTQEGQRLLSQIAPEIKLILQKINTLSDTKTAAEINRKSYAKLKLQKLADTLKDQRLQTRFEFDEKLEKLSNTFRGLYSPDYNLFEKNALALCKNEPLAWPILRAIRGTSDGHVKHAADDKFLAETSPEVEEFIELIKIANKAVTLDKGIKWLTEHYNH